MNDKANLRRFEIQPIGVVCRSDRGITLNIYQAFRPALEALEHFSHVNVLCWADRLDDEEWRSVCQVNPPYAEDHVTGIFATRSPHRPNPILTTTCSLESVDQENGVVRIANIDALDGTPVIDLKGYFPVCDRVREAHIPPWLEGWSEWMPDEGMGLEPWEA